MKLFSNINSQRFFTLFLLLALFGASIVPTEAQRRRPRITRSTRTANNYPARYTVAADEVIRVRMNGNLSSKTARVGERFTTTVTEPVYANGVEVIPAGSTIAGRVTSVKRAGRKSEAGSLGVEFISLRLPNGASQPITGSLTTTNGENNEYDNEGQVRGRSSRNRNIVFIGGGAGTGALIGAIAGGGKGAGIGAGIGAGLGVAGAYFSRGKEAEVKPGTEFGVILNRSISLAAYNR